jgi:hypothetical protein
MPILAKSPKNLYPPRWTSLPIKIVDTTRFDAWPRAPYKRPDNTWVFVYWKKSASGTVYYDLWEANSTDLITWTTSVIWTNTTTWDIAGMSGMVPSTGTELVSTSSYKLPFPSTPNNAPRTWRRATGGAWTRVGDWSIPSGDSIAVPFGRFVQLASGSIRATGCGWDAARTYAHIWYVDSADDGLTWGSPVTIYKGNSPTGANELCYAVSPTNSAHHLVVTRREDEYGTHEGGMRVFKSTDTGATFTEMGEIAALVGRYAAAPDLLVMNDGRLVLLYGDRGDIAYYGSAQQHTMRMVVGYFETVFTDLTAWSSSVILQNTYPATNGDSGYGGLFKTTSLDSSLSMVWFDGTDTDTDIWQAGIGDMFPIGYR